MPYCLLFIICAFLMFMELELMNDGAFLSKMLATQLDRLDLISDIPVLDTDGKEIVLESYDIELNDVTFAYDTRQVLDGISLKIPQNSTCAIVGPSGSGKTTLCNIIARFWDVNSGSVKIGGHDVREFTCDSLLSYVSMVFQKVYLFNDTIENNIKFGKPNASHTEVVEAAMIICCLIAGIISALIAWKTGCTNGKTLTISYIIYMILAAFSGTYIPFLFFSKQTLEQYAGMFGESYLGILQTLVSPVTAIIMLVVVAICAFIGALIAKKLLKKHFKKAGMV